MAGPLLIPIIGHTAFSHYAELALLAHNATGPLFVAGLLLMLLIWAKDNIPNALDIQWLKACGGMIGHKHPSAERINTGEKGWFWLLVVAGTVAGITGLILVFPALDLGRNLMQLSHILHACSAILLCIGAFGHIYIGSIGTEGALEAMTTGKVDASWAKQHHDLWYQQIKEQTPDNRSDD